MELAVAICTHNRAEELRRTLSSLRGCVRPTGGWQLVVIDNASTDSTPQVIDDALVAGDLPIRHVIEPNLGLCHARNRALEACAGEAILFLDDDVDVDPLLLVSYEAALDHHPEAGYFGGPIRPILEDPLNPLAHAILSSHPGAFSCVDLGPAEQVLDEPGRAPFGANMCIRRSVIGETSFDLQFSYVGRGGIVGDETDFFHTLRAKGVTGRWVPSAAVGHRIPAGRASWSFVERFARGVGRSSLLMERKRGELPPITLRTAVWYFRQSAATWWRARQLSDTAPLREQVNTR
jgi:glycosyltransferase involved in cell wall biosynthesis